MRLLVLFSVLFLVLGTATYWHFQRGVETEMPSLSTLAPTSDPTASPALTLTPQDLKETHGQLTLGGGEPPSTIRLPEVPSAAPASAPAPSMPEIKTTAPSLSTQSPVAPVAPASWKGDLKYKVQSGDTLGEIAKKKYGSAAPKFVNAIAKKNNLKNANALKVGMELILPDPETIQK